MEVKNGFTTHFWHDKWVDEEKLWNDQSSYQTRALGIQRNGRVADACTDSSWNLRRPRDHQLRLVYGKVQSLNPPDMNAGDDLVLWKEKEDSYNNKFTATNTWKLIRTTNTEVSWAHIVWFPLAVPRQSFVVWLAFKDCLTTGDKMRSWGVSQNCVLCGERNETKEHLFFGCPYSFQAWILLARNLLPRKINPDWNITITAVGNKRAQRIDSHLLRLTFQSLVYALWRERNKRIHQGRATTFRSLAWMVARLIQDRIQAYKQTEEHKQKLMERWKSIWNEGKNSLNV